MLVTIEVHLMNKIKEDIELQEFELNTIDSNIMFHLLQILKF